jgi:CheY-like chemotaxis protein
MTAGVHGSSAYNVSLLVRAGKAIGHGITRRESFRIRRSLPHRAGDDAGPAEGFRFLESTAQPARCLLAWPNVITGAETGREGEQNMAAIMSRNPIRILLTDDSTVFLKSASSFLAGDPQLEVVGLAHSGQESLRLVVQLRPDLVLMDIKMPEMTGLEATRRIKEFPDAPRVIIVTLYDTPTYRAAAEEVRADGFIAKAEFTEQILPLIYGLFGRQDPSVRPNPECHSTPGSSHC